MINESKMIYQKSNGKFLPINQQPVGFVSNRYKPHKSTRYKNITIGTNGIPIFKIKEKQIETNKKLPELYKNKEKCCGCTACANQCNHIAISMEFDEEGFKYPVVDAEKCIRCYKCISICPC